METASLDLKDTECPVCHKYYKEPKILPCAHLLCHNCLVDWMKTNENAQCPVCRWPIMDPRNRDIKTCDDLADELPIDDVMTEMIENMKLLNQERVCYVHRDMVAKSFCLHCGIMLCTTCAEAHIKIPATSSHRLEALETLTLESVTSIRQSPCSAHPEKMSKLYCIMHDVLICKVCALSKHRACPEVPFLNEMLEKSKNSLSEMENKLSTMESALSKIVAEIEVHLDSLQQNTKDSFTQIDTACDRLVLSIENCRKRLKKLVQDENDNIMAGLNKQKDFQRLFSCHRSLINRIQLSAPCTSLVSMVPRLNKRVSEFNWKPLTTAKLTIDEKVLSSIELELTRLGQMNVAQEQNMWQFHPNHDKHIVLTNNGMTAELQGHHYGTVFSSEPMKVNMLYEIRVEEIDTRYDGCKVGYGLVTEDPAAITDLPLHGGRLQSAIVVFEDCIYIKTRHFPYDVDVAYETLKVGSRIGVVVDDAQCLHIFLDGKDQGVVYRGVHHPCYALFDLYSYFKKVTILPLTLVQQAPPEQFA